MIFGSGDAMTMKRTADGSTYVDTATEKRFDGVSWVDLTVAKKFDGVSWTDIAFPGGGGGTGLSATASVGTVFGSEFRLQPPTAPAVLTVGSDTPSQVTITASGGTGPYTYAWTHLSGDSAIQVVNPTGATTGFVANLGKNQSKSATKRCTITDAAMASVTVDIGVTLQYTVES